MAVLWQSSLVPFIDRNGTPRSGAQAFFFDAGTTTPMTVYTDSALSVAWGNPVVADDDGVFPAVFLPPTQYHLRLEDADGVTLQDVDGIDPPQAANFVPPDAGSTDPTLLAATGDIKARHGTGVVAGWVRAAGRSIGNATSGATERANADASALFQYLWAQDTTLAVSGSRGSTAAGDFAAGKKLTLPDYRSRSLAGLATMGNTDAALIAGSLIDGSETTDTLGATVGTSTHQLTSTEMPGHTHTGTIDSAGAHTHDLTLLRGGGNALGSPSAQFSADTVTSGSTTGTTTSAAAHTHTMTNASTGGDTAHTNMQPSVLVTWYLKL